jgi:exopolyphosphatase/pppGpp-phosphohydrolase
VVGANALRVARNRDQIKKWMKKDFRFELKIISGKEARLAFLGTHEYTADSDRRIVIDIGGGSTEIISGIKNKIHIIRSIKMRVVSISEKYLNNEEPGIAILNRIENYIQSEIGLFTELKYAPPKPLQLQEPQLHLYVFQRKLFIITSLRLNGAS